MNKIKDKNKNTTKNIFEKPHKVELLELDLVLH